MLPQMILGWLVYLVLVALTLAAFLHWRRIQRSFLLILGMAPLCLLLGLLMVRLGEMPLRGATALQRFAHPQGDRGTNNHRRRRGPPLPPVSRFHFQARSGIIPIAP